MLKEVQNTLVVVNRYDSKPEHNGFQGVLGTFA